ncbi:MAG: amino acid permease [Bdellovibrionales bacterium]|nr:amino acid permease [Bdellovibrionales bacterium]
MNVKSLFRTKSIDTILTEAALDPNAHGTHGSSEGSLKRTLGVWDLTALGIAAVIGAGIFSTIGNAAASGGPGVSLLFIFTAIACAFSAFCYAEFASSIPVAGSAYTYAYASLGEIIAWIIGWDLLMEYAIGNIAVAISWSDYFTSLLDGYGIHVPTWMSMDLLTASRGYDAVKTAMDSGIAFTDLVAKGVAQGSIDGYNAWTTAPQLFGFHLIGDIPAMIITVVVTAIVYIGIQESKRINNAMVILKILVLMLVIGLGAFYVKPENWSPFAPNGVSGILKGVSAVFFAYIGFDAISTTAEECKNPQRDLPRAMIYSLVICTVLYIAVALVLTGIVRFDKLAVGDPLAYAFGPEGASVNWVAGVIAISAVVALFTVLLVFQLGQPRIWMAMSRDGLLPPVFSAIHPKYKTPWFSTIVAGFFVAIPCIFMNLTEVTDLTSIGTLSAFVLVCLGVLRLDPHRPKVPGRFYTPYINGKILFPVLCVLFTIGCIIWNNEGVTVFFQLGEWEVFKHKIPMFGFLIFIVGMCVWTYRKSLSLIPLMGVTSCAYLMTELGWTNWVRFILWLIVGLVIYFFYSYQNSKLAKKV